MTIGRLAKMAGVPISTIRYYERRGLLRPPSRTPGNYRLYDEATAVRVRFIRAAQAAGFTLADIEQLVELDRQSAGVCARVQGLIDARLAETLAQLDQLERARDALTAWHEACRSAQRSGSCVVLADLVEVAGASGLNGSAHEDE